MTKAEIELMKRALFYHLTADTNDEKLIEVGWINGVSPKVAKKLVEIGLLVNDMPTYANETTNTHVRIPTIAEIKELEAWKGFHFG